MAFVAVLSVGAVVGIDAAGLLHDAELKTIDLRFHLRGSETPRQDVVLVAVDNKTLSALNRQPPYPRSLHARLIDTLHRAGARVIGYDIQFVGTTTPAQDRPLVAALSRASPHELAQITGVGNAANGRRRSKAAQPDQERRAAELASVNNGGTGYLW